MLDVAAVDGWFRRCVRVLLPRSAAWRQVSATCDPGGELVQSIVEQLDDDVRIVSEKSTEVVMDTRSQGSRCASLDFEHV